MKTEGSGKNVSLFAPEESKYSDNKIIETLTVPEDSVICHPS
jgi:hypothetical protein